MKTLVYFLLSITFIFDLSAQTTNELNSWRIGAESNFEQESYKPALLAYLQLHQNSSQTDSTNWYAIRIGDCYQRLNMADSALIWTETGKKGANLYVRQWAYLIQGQAWQLKAKHEEAMQRLDSLQTLLNNRPNAELQILAWSEKVNVYIRQSKLTEADSINKIAIRLSTDKWGKVQPRQIFLLANAGVIARRRNEPKEAMAYFNQALTVAQQLQLQSSTILARLQVNIGNLLIDNTAFEKAIWHYEKSLSISEKIYGRQHNLSGIAHRGLATAYRNQGSLDKALFHFKAALGIFVQISGEKSSNTANIYGGMGVAYLEAKKYASALDYFEKSLAIAKVIYEPNHTELGIIYSNLATVYKDIKRLDKAIGYYNQALGIYSQKSDRYAPRIISTHIGLASVYLAKKDTSRSRKYLALTFASLLKNDSLELYNLSALEQAISQKAGSLETEEFQLGVETYAVYLLQSYELSQRVYYLEKGYELGKIYINFIKHKASALAEIKDKIAFAGKLIDALEIFARINLKLYEQSGQKRYLEMILCLIEQNKAIALLANSQNDALSQSLGLPDSQRDKEQDLQQNIKQVEMDLTTAQLKNEVETIQHLRLKLANGQEEYDRFKEGLKTDYNLYYQNRYGHQVVKLDSIQAHLGQGQWLLEYLEGTDYTIALAMTRAKVAVKLIPKENYNMALLALRGQLSGISIYDQNNAEMVAAFAKEAEVLYRELLQFGFETFQERPQSLLIVADGRLSGLPFEVLIAQKPTLKQIRWDSLDYLIKSYPISYAYSATFWAKNINVKAVKKSYRQMLAMAAAYDVASPAWREDYLKDIRKQLGALAGVQEEIKGLKASRWAGRFVYGSKCNEKNFKKQAEGYQIIHLAMHGLADKQQPTLSSLAFSESQDSVEDNFLYVYEIMNMKFSADLVVLSACETGSGEFQQGAGVVSAGYAFSYAGVPAVVTSLWSVNDQTTAILMQSFYVNLAAGMSKDKALQAAKLAYLGKSTNLAAHPALWSAFILTGNTEPIAYISGFRWGAFGYVSGVAIALMSVYVAWVLINYMRLRWLGKRG